MWTSLQLECLRMACRHWRRHRQAICRSAICRYKCIGESYNCILFIVKTYKVFVYLVRLLAYFICGVKLLFVISNDSFSCMSCCDICAHYSIDIATTVMWMHSSVSG